MKYFAFLLIALVAFVAAEEEWKPITDKEAFRQIYHDCLKESGVSTEQTEKINMLEHPDEKEVQEYIHCAATKIGVFNDDKGWDMDRLMSQFESMVADVEQLRPTLTACLDNNEQKSTPAEWAFRGHKCLMDSKFGETLKRDKQKA